MKRRTMTQVAVCLALLGAPAIGSANSVTSGSGGNCERESAPEDVLERHRINAHDMALGLFDFLEGNARMAAIVSRAGSDLSHIGSATRRGRSTRTPASRGGAPGTGGGGSSTR